VSLDAGGTVAPGVNGTGTLTVGSLTSASGAVLRSSVQSGGTCTKLMVNGALNVSAMNLVVTGTVPEFGSLVLAEGTSLTGSFLSVDLSGVTPAGSSIVYVGNQVLIRGPTGSVMAIQ
jgi:hypothetical protein